MTCCHKDTLLSEAKDIQHHSQTTTWRVMSFLGNHISQLKVVISIPLVSDPLTVLSILSPFIFSVGISGIIRVKSLYVKNPSRELFQKPLAWISNQAMMSVVVEHPVRISLVCSIMINLCE